MTIYDAMGRLSQDDPYEDSYAWLYKPMIANPAKAALYLLRPDGCWAGIGIYDESQDTMRKSIDWALTSDMCSWKVLQIIPWDIAEAITWRVAPRSQIFNQLKEAGLCAT